ncbi:hypothetical protein V5799_030293 [Amblyomma americanum]|uniref:Core Histone H2A/H2B/H3 domain-containing protein n=1 Tax=Amblyomma americanum TaxID=6943 RepID=A0AAQ4EP64_AMBAM
MTRSPSTSESSSLGSAFLKEKSADRDVDSGRRTEPPPRKQPSPRGSFWGRVSSHEEFRAQGESPGRKRRPEVSSPLQTPPKKIIHATPEYKAGRQSLRKSSYFIPPDSPGRPQWTSTPLQTPQKTPQRVPWQTPRQVPPQTLPWTPRREDAVLELRSAQKSATYSLDRQSRVNQEDKVSSPQRAATPRPEVSPPLQTPPRKSIHATPEHKAGRRSPRKSSFFIPPDSPGRPQQTSTPLHTPQKTPQQVPQQTPRQVPPRTPRREDTVLELRSAQKSATYSLDRQSRVNQEDKVSSPQRAATPRPEVSPPLQTPPRKSIHATPEHKAGRRSPRKSSFFIPPDSPGRPQQTSTPLQMPQKTPQQVPQQTPRQVPPRTPPRTPRHEDTVLELRSAQKSATYSPDRQSRVNQEHEVSSPQRAATPRMSPRKSPNQENASLEFHRKTAASATSASQTVQSSRKNMPKKKAVGSHGVRQASGSRVPSGSLGKQGQPKAHKRRRVGYLVFREITRYQRSTEPLIPRLAFARAVRDILWRVAGEDYRMQKLALQALHEAGEAVIVALLEGSNVLARHARRVTVMNRDLAVLLAVIKSYGGLQQSLA